MMNPLLRVSRASSITFAVLLCITIAAAQQPTPSPTPNVRECSTPVYKSSEVDRRVKVLTFPEPNFEDREFQRNQRTVIVLRSIFCGSGKVTDIKVQTGVSKRLDEEALRTAKTIRFRPAEKNGEKVSQWMTLEYHIDRW